MQGRGQNRETVRTQQKLGWVAALRVSDEGGRCGRDLSSSSATPRSSAVANPAILSNRPQEALFQQHHLHHFQIFKSWPSASTPPAHHEGRAGRQAEAGRGRGLIPPSHAPETKSLRPGQREKGESSCPHLVVSVRFGCVAQCQNVCKLMKMHTRTC